MPKELLSIKGLKKYFPYKENLFVKAVDGVDVDLYEGEILGLVGESGSGKSTIAYTVVGMYNATEGQLIYKGKDINYNWSKRDLDLRGDIQIVFQDPGSSLNPQRTIRQTLDYLLRLHNKRGNSGFSLSTEDLLRSVGLSEDYLMKYPGALSGGEKQLIAIAKSLATYPSLVLLDEPTASLDVSLQARVINCLLDLQKNLNLTYLFITHDLSLMRNVADRVAIMYLGKICEQASTIDFFNNPSHPYTKMLLSSIPTATKEEDKFKPDKIKSTGEIPSPINIPSGCSFHTRCPECTEICIAKDPLPVKISETHWVRCHLFNHVETRL